MNPPAPQVRVVGLIPFRIFIQILGSMDRWEGKRAATIPSTAVRSREEEEDTTARRTGLPHQATEGWRRWGKGWRRLVRYTSALHTRHHSHSYRNMQVAGVEDSQTKCRSRTDAKKNKLSRDRTMKGGVRAGDQNRLNLGTAALKVSSVYY